MRYCLIFISFFCFNNFYSNADEEEWMGRGRREVGEGMGGKKGGEIVVGM